MMDSKSPSEPRRLSALARVRLAGIAAALAAFALLIQTGGDATSRSLFDAYQRIGRPAAVQDDPVRVVLIDAQSLRAVGPWPWPRYMMARLTEEIAARGAVAIGFDMMFPETDRYSPDRFVALYPELAAPVAAEVGKLPSFDAQFAEVIGRAPVVLGRAGVEERGTAEVEGIYVDPRRLPVEASFTRPLPPGAMRFPYALTSIPALEEVAMGHGVINGPPDDDGVVRRVPLVAEIAGNATPGLALELARIARGEEVIGPRVAGRVLSGVGLGKTVLPVDGDGRMRLRFSALPAGSVFSAADLLRRGVAKDAFAGKVVLVGLGSPGTADIVATPIAPETYGVLVQAQAVRSILAGDALVRPRWAPPIEWLAGGLLLLLALFVQPRLRGWWTWGLPLGVVLGFFAVSALAYLSAGLLIDPVRPLAIGVAAGTAVFVMLFAEGGRVQRRLRVALADERLAGARAAGELEAARDIQLGMLPPREKLSGLNPSVDLDARLEPARSVGGDFYEAFALDGDRLCFLVGDVTGKGVPAALFMALSRALTKSVLLREGGDLAAAMRTLNRELARDNGEDMFLTMLVGVLDARTGAVALCNAGHENPLLIAPDGTVSEIAMEGGPPLCVVDDYPYVAEPITLPPGAALIILSDGVTEAQAPDGALFGHARVAAELVRIPPGRPVAQASDALVRAVRRFEAGGDPSDDLTVLALRYTVASA